MDKTAHKENLVQVNFRIRQLERWLKSADALINPQDDNFVELQKLRIVRDYHMGLF